MHKPHNYRGEFESLVRRLAASTIRLCAQTEAEQVVGTAHERFVIGSPRTWWLSLKNKPSVYHYPKGDGFQHLREHAPADAEQCWLILETEEDTKPVAEIDILLAPAILGEMPNIEYYLVDKAFRWLIIENDHNELLLCIDPQPRE
jgi:hypothetical protein